MDTRTILGQNAPQKQSTDQEVEDLLELNKLFAKLESIDLSKVEAEVIKRRTPLEGVIEALSKNEKAISRKPAKKKVHYKVKRRKYREYYARVVRPKRAAAMAEAMIVGGWWPRMSDTWKRHKVEVELTEEEWNETIVPLVGDGVPMISRYKPKEPISLDNIWVTLRDTGVVVFDGKEYLLKKLGYIVES